LIEAQRGIDAAAAIGADAERQGSDAVESAQRGSDQILNEVRNLANATDALNSWGNLLTQGATEAIRSGLNAAGTAIGTAVGQDIVDDNNGDGDRKQDEGSSGSGELSSTSAGGSQPASVTPRKPPETTEPPPAVASPCPICGRTDCGWWRAQQGAP
jgi:hypothetical protein